MRKKIKCLKGQYSKDTNTNKYINNWQTSQEKCRRIFTLAKSKKKNWNDYEWANILNPLNGKNEKMGQNLVFARVHISGQSCPLSVEV